ncbi:DNA cytosine methyltransferase [Lapidilactobacillus luobeiensis]|uniref:DNA cytosine methyltransferase n=1 Tax=Lapidilactobacillus luobeiensis TaxID=2950371 RepID=UPI0021C33E87|nr:DNA cytosine methyltransferase [Lapidilactobacillus luobeiensis]
MNIIDLFSGAGGLTEGFRHDFNIVGHVEKEAAASETLRLRDAFYYFKANHRESTYYDFLNNKLSLQDVFGSVPTRLLKGTINEEINDNNIQNIFKQLDERIGSASVDGLIGGPPCQAYSTIGRARNAPKKASDGRIYLYRYYIDFLRRYLPKFFVFENVRGLLSFKDMDGQLLFPKMKLEFQKAGYNLDYRVLDASDFGTPQSRKRVIIFGARSSDTQMIQRFFDELSHLKTRAHTVRETFYDLPRLSAGTENNNYAKIPTKFIKKNFRGNASIPLTQNCSRPNNDNDLQIYQIVAKAKANGINVKYNELNQKLITHRHTDKFLDRFKALGWDEPSHTIVAHIAKDGHHYIHPDYTQNRSITVREAARLQGFPDDYYFESSRTSALTQIGNAVPPIFSKKVAEAINSII